MLELHCQFSVPEGPGFFHAGGGAKRGVGPPAAVIRRVVPGGRGSGLFGTLQR